ncbi:hypothetical protein AVEN_251412-1 [Araneus ventricosus]|uniref:DUF5641 domain-containing protein n=1 Tax=Araneus ventricosus TaxID=182803 RepID=A0A4Y2KZJ1_ARAVE|nr:hypothetical protein AVEN_251412-1 [Araneus ventricosus]
MTTVLADCGSVINSRPLTYLCEDETVKPISPSMFLQDSIFLHECSVPDIDQVGQTYLRKRLKCKESLLKSLRKIFRYSYLTKEPKKKKLCPTVAVGDIVLVGADNSKRINWPLGCITEVIPGKDGCVRLVKVRTKH